MRRILIALLALLAAAPASALAATPVRVGTGLNPWVFVDRQGTTHVAWDVRSANDSTLHYRRRPAGAAAFEAERVLPVATVVGNPGLDSSGPRIVQDPAPSNRLVIVVTRCCDMPSTYALTSADGGVTWSAAVPIYAGSAAVNPTDGPVGLLAATASELLVVNGNPGPVRVVKVPGDLSTVVAQADPAREIALGPPEAAYNGSVALDENGQPVYAFATLRDLFLRVGEAGATIPAGTSEFTPTVKIAGGPRGVVALVTTGNAADGNRLTARRLLGGTLGAPVQLSAANDRSPAVGFVSADQTGRFHAVWRGPGNALVYRRSEDGVAWNAPTTLVGASVALFGPVASAGPDGKGWVVYTTGTGDGAILAVPLEVGGQTANPAVPDLTGITNPVVTRNGPTTLVSPRRVSLRTLRRTKCVRVRVQASRPARVRVAIFSGRRSVRLFGVRTVVFTRPGKRVVCIRVPLRAVTANIRQPFRFVTAFKLGARPRPNEGPGRQRTRPFVLFP